MMKGYTQRLNFHFGNRTSVFGIEPRKDLNSAANFTQTSLVPPLSTSPEAEKQECRLG